MGKVFGWIITVLLAAIILNAFVAAIIAFPIGAVCYGVFTCGTALTPAISFWGWYGIAAAGIFIICLLFGNNGKSES